VWSLTHAFPRAKLSTEIGRVTQSVLTRCLDRYFDWVLAENRPEYASRPWAETGEGRGDASLLVLPVPDADSDDNLRCLWAADAPAE